MNSGVSRCFMQSLSNRVRTNETPRYAEMQIIETMSVWMLGRVPAPQCGFVVKIVMRATIVGCCDVQVVNVEDSIKSYLWSRGGEDMYVPCMEDEWEGGMEKRLQAIHTSWTGA